MASITTQERTNILKLVAGMFNAAPGATYLTEFTDAYIALNKDLGALATALGQTAPFQALYPSFLTSEEFANKFLATLGLEDNEEAQEWVQAQKNAGADNASIIFQALVAIETSTADEFKAARDQLANKAAVAEYYSVELGKSSDSLEALQAVVANVTNNPASVQAAKDAVTPVEPQPEPQPEPEPLTAGQDVRVGTAGNDLFKANVVQNALGEQTNSLATGDHIDGGAGQDSLFATVQQASALNQGPASAIMPSTVSVETVEFRALADSNVFSPANDRVVINAKDMLGVETLGSVHSDASLLIKDVTTLTNNGEYADKRETSALTVRMDHTGNGNAVDRASDLTVLFDNDYLIPTGTNQSVANYWLLDEDAELDGNPDRLANIDVNGLSFTIDGEVFNVYAVANPLVDLFSGSHAEFVAALQADLAEQQAAGTIPDYISISLDPNNTRTTGLENGTLSNPIPAIVISSTGDVVGPRGFNRPEDTPGEYDVWARLNNDASSTSLITATIELEKVGRGADGGELIVGGMATDWRNEWDFSESALEEGVEQFNITVSGDATQNSSLSSLKSTNNTLQVVNVVSAAGSEADLFIGNANTILTADNASLKDVRVFDSTAFANDVILTRAVISDEAADKYMDLWDDALDATGTQPAADNIDFIYSFGAGDDVLEINIDKSNLAWVGSTTREDFSFTANMGDGDDAVYVAIGDDDGLATSKLDHWYVNSTLNKNLDINAGAGDDFVWTHRSGTWQINMGTGSDTVYSDQSGDTAVWVFNTYHNALDGAGTLAARNLDNLRSSENTPFGSLFKTELVVNFRGIESTIVLGAEVNTDLELNQYIKAAINNDDVLGELLVAEDGPANTLVVYSLVDGAVVAEDLALTFVAPVAAEFNQADVNAYAAAYNVSAATLSPAALEALVAANLAGFNLQNDYASRLANDDGTAATEFNGSNSTQVTESTITVNLDATDVIVLSTGAASEESIILEGTQDALPLVILNFDAANGDTIQYRSANGLETTRVTGDQVEILNTEGTWDVVAVVEFATAAGGTDPVVPGQTNQIVANGVNYDASTGAFNYILDFSLTPKEDWAADIAGFGADDTVTVINAGGAARPMFGTQPAATDFDFAYVLNDYSASWTLTMTGQDAALVADVLQGAVGGVVAGAAADAAVVELAGVWGADWLNLAS